MSSFARSVPGDKIENSCYDSYNRNNKNNNNKDHGGMGNPLASSNLVDKITILFMLSLRPLKKTNEAQ